MEKNKFRNHFEIFVYKIFWERFAISFKTHETTRVKERILPNHFNINFLNIPITTPYVIYSTK